MKITTQKQSPKIITKNDVSTYLRRLRCFHGSGGERRDFFFKKWTFKIFQKIFSKNDFPIASEK